MPEERFRTNASFDGWDGEADSLLAIAKDVMQAVSIPADAVRIRLSWREREGDYETFQAAHDRLRNAATPSRVEINFGADGPGATPPVSVRLLGGPSRTGHHTFSAFVEGSDWQLASRAWEAVIAADSRAEQRDAESPDTAGEERRRGAARQWVEDNQGVVAVIGIVVTVVLAVAGFLLA
jgi:hypothetical protein